MRDLAIRIIAQQFRIKPRSLQQKLVACWTHDWQRDPFARGSYSYAAVNGKDAARTLTRSVQRTLYFAGEAISQAGRNGTVDGAIESGRRAAKALSRE
jgi:monoamine oxidase